MSDTPRLSVRREYPDESSPPTEVTFGPSPSYGLLPATDAHDWFLRLIHQQEGFEVQAAKAG